MNTDDSIEEALTLLENMNSDSLDPPATIVMPPDSGKFVIGNSAGFVQLAIASLRAAKGERQSFKEQPWFHNYDVDWGLMALEPDASAHLYLPAKRARIQQIWRTVFGIAVVIIVLVCFIAGFIAIVSGLSHL